MKSEDKIMEQGIIKAVCISPAKGTEKQNVHHAHVIENWGSKTTRTQATGIVRSACFLIRKSLNLISSVRTSPTARSAKTCW